MINAIKQKIALLIAKRKYFSKGDATTNFTGKVSSAQKFLVLLPDNSEDTLSAVDIPTYYKINKKEVTILGYKNVIPIALETHSFDSISFSEEELTKFGLPNKELVDKIKSKEFDVVIDLNRRENFIFSVLSNIPKSAVKIGYKKEKSDVFYNFQVANNQNNAEISYRNFLNSIQMF